MSYQHPQYSAGVPTSAPGGSSSSSSSASNSGIVSASSRSPAHPPPTAATSVTTPSSKGRHHYHHEPEHPPLRTPSHTSEPLVPQSRRTDSSSKNKSSHSPRLHNDLEYYTNNSFSRSFNSLILDDIKDDLTSTSSKKKINKSPPFNIKHGFLHDKLDDYAEEDLHFNDEIVGDELDNEDLSTLRATQSNTQRSSGSNRNTPHHHNTQRNHSHYGHSRSNSRNGRNLSRSRSNWQDDLLTFSEGEETEKVQSQQSSIKRSSKFLNLSIDSNLRSMDNKVSEDIDYISDLNEIDSSIIRPASASANLPSSASISREPTPIENSSPITSRHSVLPSSNNKFKRPHKLVSQSPSPSSTKINASKALIYSFNKSPETKSQSSSAFGNQTSASSYIQPAPTRVTQSEALEYFSPSKLGRKGFKMFKNADKDAIISPNRSTPERTPRASTIFAESKQQENKLLSSNKLRKTSLNYNKSPFHRKSSSPISCNFEYYNIDEMDFDSPSKNRKLSNSSNNSIVIYQDDNPVNTARKQQQPVSSHSPSTSLPSYPFGSHDFDDKENKSSYRFVKPLQTAFKSTGLVKKNSISKESRKLPPETPMKKNPLMLINTNKSSLSNIISSAHEEMMDDNSEISIEVGRNNISAYNSTLNESNSSFFRIPSTNNSSQKTSHLNILNNADLDIDSSSDIEIGIPETPTKSVKKSHSTPANFSPVSFKNSHKLSSYLRNANQLSISTTSLDSSNPPTPAKYYEPSTPTNLLYKSSMLPSKNHSDFHVCDKKRLSHKTNSYDERVSSSVTIMAKEEDDHTLTFKNKPHFEESDVDLEAEATLQSKESIALPKIDDHLISKFGMKNIKYIGEGEFSIAYECIFQGQKLAIKRSKKPILGKIERKSIRREIEALRALTSVKDNESVNMQEQEEGKEYLVYFIEAWDFNNYYYIMTEYCDNGTLFDFLEENKNYKMDEFRIWKILIEILSGLRFIHSKNYLHLDLKPANIFVTFEGSLKIGDFGLTTKLPILEKDFDLEGDRNYIAPELINDKIYTPFADIFSLGLIILEIAANIILPDNGTPWRKLRSGDLSDAGKLSSDNISDFLSHQNFSSVTSYNTNNMNFSSNQSVNLNGSTSNHLQQPVHASGTSSTSNHKNLKGLIPPWAPEFLVSGDSMKLDKLVNKMLRPNPFDRPNCKKILDMEECSIIENRRKAGATIFEGEFGPHSDDEDN